jgi:hypothetical protein
MAETSRQKRITGRVMHEFKYGEFTTFPDHALAAVQIDQRNAELRPLPAPQPHWGFGQHDLQRRPYDAGEEMTAARRAVGQSQHDMDMQARAAVVAERDVADRA